MDLFTPPPGQLDAYSPSLSHAPPWRNMWWLDMDSLCQPLGE